MYGEIGVEMLSQSESPERTIRKFRLEYADESQDVLHLNYTSWPDHGVPTVNAIESILQFVHIVRQQANRTKRPHHRPLQCWSRQDGDLHRSGPSHAAHRRTRVRRHPGDGVRDAFTPSVHGPD